MGHRRPIPPVGRDGVLDTAQSHLDQGESVLLVGPAGIGKSTLLSVLAERLPGRRVLRASAAAVESGLPYLTLHDLFGAPRGEYGDGLPGHLRSALDAALLRTAPPGSPQDELAVRLAVLELLRLVAADAPVLLVIDDLQWVDEPSAGVLHFVARRIRAGEESQVIMLAAERTDGEPVRAHLCPEPHLRLPVHPLTEPDTAALLRARFGSGMSRVTVERIHAASGGNPLFAVELGRAVTDHGEPLAGAEPLPVPGRLRALLSARVAALPPTAMAPLTVVAAAARPTRELLIRAGVDPRVDLAEAVAAGVLVGRPDGGTEFSHPLIGEMVYADADLVTRRAAHEALAHALADPVERARHLALARPDPDESLAGTLFDAAAVASRRGAPAIAADLADLAAERTPEPARGADRRLVAAKYAHASNLVDEARRWAHTVLEHAISPESQVDARLLLVELAGQDQSGIAPLLDEADEAASGSLALAAKIGLYRADKAFYDGDWEAALAEVKRAEGMAERTADAELLVKALGARAGLEIGYNVRESEEILDRANRLAARLPLSSAVVETRRRTVAVALRRGEMITAVRDIELLRGEVERSGTVSDLADVLHTAASVYSRAGRCADALAAGRYCLRLHTDTSTGSLGAGLLIAALTELGGGTLAQAEGYVQRAIATVQAAGNEDWLKGAYAVQGQILLLRGDPAAAVEPMRRSYTLESRRGPVDPAGFLWHADFVEALAGAGCREEAQQVLDEARGQARRLERHVVELGLTRASAVLDASRGQARAAVADLDAAARDWTEHPYPLEVARAYHTLGAVERRAHRRGAAREALREAVSRYAVIGAAPWQAAAEGELARLDGARGAALSDTEQRIVELLRGGATNREIARTTFLSIKAVEANLTRLYRRYGVRGRDQLTRAINGSD